MNVFKSMVCAIMSIIMIVVMMPKSVQAAGIPGTDISVRMSGRTLVVEGNGEIPDYTPATYTQRPWHYLDFDYVSISDGITRVGKYAFADIPIKMITIKASTFVADGTSFMNVGNKPILRISGTTSSIKQIGTINYESMDSIIANAPTGNNCAFILDNGGAVQAFWSRVYPFLPYTYAADEKHSPWEKRESVIEGYKFNAVCKARFSPVGATTNMHARLMPQGEAFIQVISNFIKDYTYDCCYNMTLETPSQVLYGTNQPEEYVLYLRGKDQIAARKYCLIQIRPDGQIAYLEDLDQDCKTVTFATDYPTSSYALVFKY